MTKEDNQISDLETVRDKCTAIDDAKLRTAILSLVGDKKKTQPAPEKFEFPKLDND